MQLDVFDWLSYSGVGAPGTFCQKYWSVSEFPKLLSSLTSVDSCRLCNLWPYPNVDRIQNTTVKRRIKGGQRLASLQSQDKHPLSKNMNRPTNFVEKYAVSADGSKIFAGAVGNPEKPALVFVHGYTLTSSVFNDLFSNPTSSKDFYLVRGWYNFAPSKY